MRWLRGGYRRSKTLLTLEQPYEISWICVRVYRLTRITWPAAGPIIEYRKAQNWDPLLPGEITQRFAYVFWLFGQARRNAWRSVPLCIA